MNDNIVKHLTNILSRLVQIFCEVEDCDHIAIEDVAQVAEGLARLGFDLDPDLLNSIVQRSLGILALNGITVELM